jgi:hypothetical protein
MPQQKAPPLSRMAHVCRNPAAMAVNRRLPLTAAGVARAAVSPVPSAP